MSYPRKIHTLIVEDELPTLAAYRALFRDLQAEYSLVEPEFVQTFEDAQRRLEQGRIFHLLILDLGLPIGPNQVVQAGVEPGMKLLEIAANRVEYPIPAALVISGRLGAANQPELRQRLAESFHYGKLVVKSVSQDDDIRRAIVEADQYVAVGVHVRSKSRRQAGGISPVEEDLLRRCVLEQKCLGVDLEWWSSEVGSSAVGSGPTHVLVGRFLLDDGQGVSRPTFFKFEPIANASFVEKSAVTLDHKLPHVQVVWSGKSFDRHLLVTQCATNDLPIAWGDFLDGDESRVRYAIPQLLDDIVSQLEQLGDSFPLQIPWRDLLWKHHKRETIAAALGRHSPTAADRNAVLTLFDRLQTNADPVWVKLRQCIHGDLNASNIAIDDSGDSPHAFIIDAGWMERGVNVRDLAYLEVTMLLFGDFVWNVDTCLAAAYGTEASISHEVVDVAADARTRNTLRMLQHLRDRAIGLSRPDVYAVAVFDAALMQVGGLDIQPSRNKIGNPADAARLATAVARWVNTILPPQQSMTRDRLPESDS